MPHRIVTADDSPVVRRLLAKVLQDDPDLELVAMATNGAELVDLVRTHGPDLIVCDVEMPQLDGLGAVSAIRKFDQATPIVMFSSLTERGAATTLEALSRGATDCAAKPQRVANAQEAVERVRTDLLPRVRALLGLPSARTPEPATPLPRRAAAPMPVTDGERPARIVAVASSTGGPPALMSFLRPLPASFSVPIVMAQHLPPVFTRTLAQRLDESCAIEVLEGTHGMELRPGRAILAPGGHHMEVRLQPKPHVILHDGPRENACRPAADPLFRSAAAAYRDRVLAVVLTGMGRDGTAGAAAIVEAGGRVLAQDEASSVVWGMPRSVVEANLAEATYPPPRLAMEALRRVTRQAA